MRRTEMRLNFIVAVVAFFSTSCSEASIVAELILDRQEISIFGPASGYVEIYSDAKFTVHGEVHSVFSFARNGMNIVVVAPDGEIINLVDDFLGDWPSPVIGGDAVTINVGQRLQIPVFLLKYGEEFFFNKPGAYRVNIFFNEIFDEPVFVSKDIRVVGDEPMGDFDPEESFNGIPYWISPFQFSVPEVDLTSEHPYFDDYVIIQAFQHGGGIVKLYYKSSKDWVYDIGVGFFDPRIQNVLDEGLVYSNSCGCNQSFWKKFQDKRNSLMQGGPWKQDNDSIIVGLQ